MQGTLKFNLPEEQGDFQAAVDGSKWKSMVFDFDQWLRSEIKYSDKSVFQPVRDMLYEFLRDSNLNLEE